MTTPKKSIVKNEDGQAIVLLALVMVVIISFATFALDIGSVTLQKSNLQDAADAAALAGAGYLPNVSNATIAAKDYAELNGADRTKIIVTTPYSNDKTMIEVQCSKTVSYIFSQIFGFTDKDITVRAVAQNTGLGDGPFNFALFSGSPSDSLTINGSNTYIGGSAHSNYCITINGSSQQITGSAEAVADFIMHGSDNTIGGTCQAATITTRGNNINIGSRITSAASSMDMPDFSDIIQTEAEAAGQAYLGNKTFNGSNLNVDDSIYVDGNVTVNGSNFTGTGVILASGNITFNGSNLTSSGSSVCFYSESGNITVNGSNCQLDGIVYAPNGSIIMNGSHQTVNGRVIGYQINFNGSNYSITAGDNDLDSVAIGGIKLVE